MSGPKLITEFDNLVAINQDQLIAVGDPSTGVLYATAVGHFLLGASGSVYGFQGNQGWQGSTGDQGFQGYQGYQGWQGLQGSFQGDQGSTGPQGPAGGPQGWQGNLGSTGNQGFQGNQGNQGFQGNQGNQGFQGNQGNQGFQGNQGNQGFQGNQGNQGWQGRQGIVGATGSQGSAAFSQIQIQTGDGTPTYSIITTLTEGRTGMIEVNLVGISTNGDQYIAGKKVARYFLDQMSSTFSVGPISNLLLTERSPGLTGVTWSIISDGLSSVLVQVIGTATSMNWLLDYKYIEIPGSY